MSPRFTEAVGAFLPRGASPRPLSYNGGEAGKAQWYREHIALAARGDRGAENARNRAYYAAHRTVVLERQRARFLALPAQARAALRLESRDRMRALRDRRRRMGEEGNP